MEEAQRRSLGKRLRRERERHHWTQEQLAEQIGGSVPSINRWENDRATPRQDMLALLTEVFGRPPERWGSTRPVRWNVPFLRNPYFTGREQVLQRLHRALGTEQAVALSQIRAISGLGGIGKTQTAIEYAYRYTDEYEAVLWVRADTRESLVSDFAALASLLDLPEKEEANQFRVIASVKRWLETHGPWLLIFDNADDLDLVAEFLPRRAGGAMLLTTRSQITGSHIKKIELDKMSRQEGVAFLLHRIGSDKDGDEEEDSPQELPAAERQVAEELWELMDGLPLALDQAGAYIDAASCSLAEYLTLYQRHQLVLLQQQSGISSDDRQTVSSTWSLSFSRVREADPAAADLLRLCAYLHPDIIPELILTEGAAELGPVLEPVARDSLRLNATIQVLRRYSLVKRDPEAKLLNIHRLVQVVLKESLDQEEQRQWAERSVRAVNRAFPEAEFAFWERCERCLPHVLLAAQWMEEYRFAFPEAARLLHVAGLYLRDRGQYAQAESLLKQALALLEQVLGPEHPDTASTLNILASVYENQDKFQQAEGLVQSVLARFEQVLGPEHPEVATALNILAAVYRHEGKYEQAELLYERALTIREQALGKNHPLVAESLNDLAVLYMYQGKYAQAETLYQRAYALIENTLGPEHPDTLTTLSNLALLYRHQGQYAQAERLQQRAMASFERVLGLEHPDTAASLGALGWLYTLQGKYAQAGPLLQRALAAAQRLLGPEHLFTIRTQQYLAHLSLATGQEAQAESLYQQVLASYEQVLGTEHPRVAETLTGLAQLYTHQGHYIQAESLLEQALSIAEHTVGAENPQTAAILDAQGDLGLLQGREEQAERLLQWALAIREKALGNAHPDVGQTLHHLAQLYEKQGKREQARSFCQHALAIREQALGPDHPDTMTTREFLARLEQRPPGQDGKSLAPQTQTE